jgi:hypothetical protein
MGMSIVLISSANTAFKPRLVCWSVKVSLRSYWVKNLRISINNDMGTLEDDVHDRNAERYHNGDECVGGGPQVQILG